MVFNTWITVLLLPTIKGTGCAFLSDSLSSRFSSWSQTLYKGLADTGSGTHPEMVAYSGLVRRTKITLFKSLNNFPDSSCLTGMIPATVGNL